MMCLTDDERRLLAAAPDLLEALVDIANATLSNMDAGRKLDKINMLARAAIAKATP